MSRSITAVTQPQILSKCANGGCGVVTYLHKSKIVNCGVFVVSAQLKTAGIPYIDHTRKTSKNLGAT